MIVGYRGRRGSGKTACMVRDAYISYLNGRKIFSNIKLNFPFDPITSESIENFKESDFKNCVLVIDEIQVLFNSRTWKNKRNMNFSIFVQQTRKRGVDIYFTTQSLRTVDVNIRENMDIHVFPKPVIRDEVLIMFEVIYFDPYASESFYNNKSDVSIYVRADPIFKLYNSDEIVSIK